MLTKVPEDMKIDIANIIKNCPATENTNTTHITKYITVPGKGPIADATFIEIVYKFEKRDSEGLLMNKSERNMPITITQQTAGSLNQKYLEVLTSMKTYEESWLKEVVLASEYYIKFTVLRIKHYLPNMQASKKAITGEEVIFNSVQKAKDLCKIYMGFQADPFIIQYAIDYYKIAIAFVKQIPNPFIKMANIAEFASKEKINISFNLALAYWFIALRTKNPSEESQKMDMCKKYCSEAENMDPKHVKAIALKAKVFVFQDCTEKAKEYLKRLLELDPENEMFKNPKYKSIVESKDGPKKDFYVRYKMLMESEEKEEAKKEVTNKLEKARIDNIDEKAKAVWDEDD